MTDTLELKFGQGEYIKPSSLGDPWFPYVQEGHIAGIALIEFLNENYERGMELAIYTMR